MAACFIRRSEGEEPERESEGKTEVTVFCNLILEVTSHHICFFLLDLTRTKGQVLDRM